MPRPSNTVFAHADRKKATSFATTPLYTIAVARYNIGSSHSIKVDLLQFCFKWFTSYKIRDRRICGGPMLNQTRFRESTCPFLVLMRTGLIFTGSVQVSGVPSRVNMRLRD